MYIRACEYAWCVCIYIMHMHMHVRMSAYIGKKKYQKYMHLCFMCAHVFVHTHTPIYNLRHSTRKHFNTQIHTQTHTHTNTGMHACMHVDTRFADHMQQLVQHVRCIDWHILRPAVLRHIMHTRIRISYVELHPSIRVLYIHLHLHAQIHTRKCVNTSVHLYM